ncbi:hypothetical protein LCGC14_1287510 [marine sediment metagenome]|uniref:Uncharacterized protein n=1 Tax=marine sediment metagenome TaxID=412755 RepID=A0A0F9LEC0_9ZZZZ
MLMIRRAFLQMLMATPLGTFFLGKKETPKLKVDDEVIVRQKSWKRQNEPYALKKGEKPILEEYMDKAKGVVTKIKTVIIEEKDKSVRKTVDYSVYCDELRYWGDRLKRHGLIPSRGWNGCYKREQLTKIS